MVRYPSSCLPSILFIPLAKCRIEENGSSHVLPLLQSYPDPARVWQEMFPETQESDSAVCSIRFLCPFPDRAELAQYHKAELVYVCWGIMWTPGCLNSLTDPKVQLGQSNSPQSYPVCELNILDDCSQENPKMRLGEPAMLKAGAQTFPSAS